MTVKSPALYLLAPISDSWVFEIGAVYDSIRVPRPITTRCCRARQAKASRTSAHAGDITVTKYFGRTAVVGTRRIFDGR